MSYAVFNERRCELLVEVLRDLKAENEIEAPPQIQVLAHIDVQNQPWVDFMRLVQLFHFQAQDRSASEGAEATQPVAGPATDVQYTFKVEP
jgi:hypothetical protein